MREIHLWDNRTLCEVFEEMREADRKKHYGYLAGLIEEAQCMANRMEAGLGDIRDIKKISARKRELKKEIRKLENKAKALGVVEKDDE